MTSPTQRADRRRDVIRMRLGRKMQPKEIAEELDVSRETILRDIKYLKEEYGFQEEMFKTEMSQALEHLLDHEMEDLHDADMAGDIDAKNDCKRSLRNTLKFVKEVQEDFVGEGESQSVDELLSDAPADVREEVESVADKLIERKLGDEEEDLVVE